jgi:thiol-disulfide isomerase/thioredoxin
MTPLITILALTIIVLLVWRLWKPFVAPPKREVPVNQARLYFFHTDWCGFCKKAMPEWEKLEAFVNEHPKFDNTMLKLVSVNAEKDRATATLYEVDAYPTIKLETREGLYTFNKAATYDNLLQFVRETLGKED